MLDDHALVERMCRGEQQAFNQFFDAFAARLGAFAERRSSLDAATLDDVVQTTMINAMRGVRTFRGRSTLFTWLCRICRNQIADLRSKAARQPKIQSFAHFSDERPLATVAGLTDIRDPLDECAVDSERGAVRRAISRLPSHYARILELRFADDLTGPDIARLLQISQGAAQSRLVRARQAFRAKWRRDADVLETTGHGLPR